MVNHYFRLITVTVVALVAFAVFITNRVIIQTSEDSSVKQKATNHTNNVSTTDTDRNDRESTLAHITSSNDHVHETTRQRDEHDRNVTLVVHLPETLGRALGVVAAARVVQTTAQSSSIDLHLLFRVFTSPRGRTTASFVQHCFPNLLEFTTFQDGSIQELDERTRQVYEQWNNQTIWGPMLDLPMIPHGVQQTLQMLRTILAEEAVASRGLYPSSNATISMPFLQTNQTFQPTFLVDPSHLGDIRRFLTLDEQKCCSRFPEQDEIVLHVKGYRRRRRWSKKTDESVLSPKKTASELLAHVPSGSKVAVVSPFHSDEFVSALRGRGLLVRNVSQYDIQDLCFLTHATKELVVEGASSFAVWAATLNTKVESIRFYNTRQSIGKQAMAMEQTTVPWLSQQPESHIQFITFEAGDLEAVARKKDSSSISQPVLDKDELSSSLPPKPEMLVNVGSPVTIVIQLSGELGNNLAKLATGKGLQLWARHMYSIETDLVLRHQDHSKWVRGMQAAKKCFPKLKGFDFELGNGLNYDERTNQQNKWLGDKSSLLRLTTARVEDIEESLSTLRSILHSERNMTDLSNSKNITFPFLLADYLSFIDVWVDKYYDDYREMFEFDYQNCCKTKPDPDETVFHFRNYAKEMPRHFKDFGFEELSPNKTANELFRDLKPGDKLAITSRFTSDPVVQTYVEALTSRGIKVRVIEGQSGEEDFCFLLSAKKELVGYAESTYAVWAGHLGNAEKVRLYSVDSPARRAGLFSHRMFHHFNWTNPKLQGKVFFELHPAEDATQNAAD